MASLIVNKPIDRLDGINAVIDQNIQPFDVVSFDIFDTAVLRRTFEPRDIFLLMQESLCVKEPGGLYNSFAHRRSIVEKQLFETVRTENPSNEISLHDIYHALTHYYPEYTGYEQMLMELELKTELSHTIQNPLIFSVYQKAIKLRKTVIFASDIYLPKAHLTTLLAQCGYDEYDKLYVSCELNVNKCSGSLFAHILKDLNIDANKVIHYGDNHWSDIEMAKRNGVTSVKVPFSPSFLEQHRYSSNDTERNIANSLYKGSIKNHMIAQTSHKASDIGYEVLGPLVYFFMNWLITHAQKKSIKNIYFVAREGWFLQQMFDLTKEKNGLAIQSHYLLASRRSLLFPYIESDTEEGFANFLIPNKTRKVSDYLKSLEVVATEKELQEAGFETNDEAIDAKNVTHDYNRLIKLLKICSDRIFANANEEKELYIKYLKSINMLENKPIAIVDSGWFGNGQKMLSRFLTDNFSDATLHGFYLALHKKAEKKFTGNSNGHGFLFQFDTNKHNRELFIELARITEVMLSAPSKSFKRFKEKNGELVPVYINENATNGLAASIEEIQQGALKFAKDQLSNDPQGLHMPDKALIKNMFINFIENPRQYEAEILSKLPYEASMLQSEKKPFIEVNNSIIDVLKNPAKALKEFNNSNWKAGFFLNTEPRSIRFFYKIASFYFYEKYTSYKLLRKIKKRIKLFN